MVNVTANGNRLGTNLLPCGRSAKVVVLVSNWPSLGITFEKPLYGVKSGTKVLAESQDLEELVAWFKSADPYAHLSVGV